MNLVTFARWRQCDRDTLIPRVVQGDVEQFWLAPKHIKHHYEWCIDLLDLRTADSFNKVPGVVLTEKDFTIFLIVWQHCNRHAFTISQAASICRYLEVVYLDVDNAIVVG
jgi:hypothetical protein